MNLNIENIKVVYLVGIGGIGMSALARYFNSLGKSVSGYDKTSTDLTSELENEGIEVHFEDNIERIPEQIDLVIYTPAIPSDHKELNWLRKKGYPVLKRAEVLGILTKNQLTVAVAGTHGKTTTSSIIAHILHESDISTTAFLGGIAKNFGSNLHVSDPTKAMVVEADEYDRSFLTLYPDIAVVTSMDADHLDIYEADDNLRQSFSLFAQNLKEDGLLVYKKGLEFISPFKCKSLTYSIRETADYYAKNITVSGGRFRFDVISSTGSIENLSLGMPGRHNIENAVAAIAVANEFGINQDSIREALDSFNGVKRRFDFVIREEDLVFIDDYAHHPAELEACISSVRELYPEKKITGVFQPHLYSRTRDFEDEFARSLELLDELILLDIYPARELPIPGVTSERLLQKVNMNEKKLVTRGELAHEIKNRDLDVLLTLGAGDIDQLLDEVKKLLLKKRQES